MKINYILTAILFLSLNMSCTTKEKKELIIGEWKFQSSINLRTNKTIKKATRNDPFYAIINKDIVILTDKKNKNENGKYHWQMKGDSIILISELNDTLNIYLKEINERKMVVDYYFLGKTRSIFEKVTDQ